MKKISEKTVSIILGSIFVLSVIAIIIGGITYYVYAINDKSKSKSTSTQIETMTEEIEHNVNDLNTDIYSVVFTEDEIQ